MLGAQGPPVIRGPPQQQQSATSIRLFGQSGATSDASSGQTTWWHCTETTNRAFPPLPPPFQTRDHTREPHPRPPASAGANERYPVVDPQAWSDRPTPTIPPSFLEPASRPPRPATLTSAEIRRRSLRNQRRAEERTARGRVTIPEWECTSCAKTNWLQTSTCRGCGAQRAPAAKVIDPQRTMPTNRQDARHHQTIEQAAQALRPPRPRNEQRATSAARERIAPRAATPTLRHAGPAEEHYTEPAGAEGGATNTLVTGRDIQAAERALQAAKDARLPPDLVASLYDSVRDLRRRAELEKPHEKRLATARRRLLKIGARLEHITANIGELEAAREKLAADHREADAYVQQLQYTAGEGDQAAGVQAARTLIKDLSQIGTIPTEIATLLLCALTAPPTPEGTPPVATTWGKIRAILDGPTTTAARATHTEQSLQHSPELRDRGTGSTQTPRPRQDRRQPTVERDQPMEPITTTSSSESDRETKMQRLTTRPPTHNEDPIETPSQSTAHSPPARKQKHSRERRQKSPARRRRGLAVIRTGKLPPRHRRQSPPTTDTSIAEAE